MTTTTEQAITMRCEPPQICPITGSRSSCGVASNDVPSRSSTPPSAEVARPVKKSQMQSVSQ